MKLFSLIEKAFFLKKVKIFEDLDLDFLLAIADKMHQDIYDKKEVIFSLGQIANQIYLVAKGKVILYSKNDQPTYLEEKGDFFGDESLYNEEPRAYRAVAATDSLLFMLSRTDLLTIISECPTVAIALLKHYTKLHPAKLL